MRHDPHLARTAAIVATPAPAKPQRVTWRRSWTFEDFAYGAAALAFFLVPGRFLVVWLWPAAAPWLGFGR